MFFFPNYFVANIYLVDKDPSWATPSRRGSEAPHVLSVETGGAACLRNPALA